MNFTTAPDIKREEKDGEKTKTDCFLSQLPLTHQSSSPAATEREARSEDIDLQQLLSMADAFNRYSGDCTERRIAREIAQQFTDGAHLRSHASVNFMGALKLAHRIGDYGLIDLIESARIQKLQACAANLASTLQATTRNFPAESREQLNFVLDSRTATVVKVISDFEAQIADARGMLNLAKTMREDIK